MREDAPVPDPTSVRDWTKEDEWLTSLDGLLAEHEEVNGEAEPLVPMSDRLKHPLPSPRAPKRSSTSQE